MAHSEATKAAAPSAHAQFISCVGYLLLDEAGDYTFIKDADEIGREASKAKLLGGYRVIEVEVLAQVPSTPRVDAAAPAGQSCVSLVARNGVVMP